MSPRTGRPTNDPKTERFEIRLSMADCVKLEYCCNELGMTKTEVLRKGLDTLYQKAMKQAKQ